MPFTQKVQNEEVRLPRPNEQSYGHDVLNMVLERGYLVRLLSNKTATSYS